MVLVLVVTACGTAAEPTAVPTEAPAAEPTVAPTAEPAPTDTPVAEAEILPSVTVADQEIVEGTVTIATGVSDGPGWLVIHAQAGGAPGPIPGYSPVAEGANAGVTVEIDTSSATETLFMNGFFRFIASPAGRAIRIVAGRALIFIGLLAVGGIWGWILAIVGLVPLFAGICARHRVSFPGHATSHPSERIAEQA